MKIKCKAFINKGASFSFCSSSLELRSFFFFPYSLLPSVRYDKISKYCSAPELLASRIVGVSTRYPTMPEKMGPMGANVTMMTRNKQTWDFDPVYVLENQVEIDFYLDNQVLIEVKLEEDIKDKQKEFFEKFKARYKRVIKGFEDLDQLETLLADFLAKK